MALTVEQHIEYLLTGTQFFCRPLPAFSAHDQFPLLRPRTHTHTTTFVRLQTLPESYTRFSGTRKPYTVVVSFAQPLGAKFPHAEQTLSANLLDTTTELPNVYLTLRATMSTTGDNHNSPTGQEYVAQFTMMDKVKEYLEALNVAVSEKLSRHAVDVHHEDLPHESAESSAASTTETGSVTPSSVRSVVPDRLNMRIPPLNYGAVIPGSIYRCSYPQPENYEFIKDLKIKSILTLVPEPIAPEYQHFMDSAGVQHFRVHIRANKGEVRVDSCEMQRALRLVMDRTNHPIMIHCNKGKHRTGCTVACFRRICGLDMETIREEYHTYAGKKARFLDEVFFENFDLNLVMWMARQENWAGSKVDCGSGLECSHQHEEELDTVDIAAPPSPPATPVMCVAASKAVA